MTNLIYRQRLINSIEACWAEYKLAAQTGNPLVGRVREIAVEELLIPLLPSGIKTGTGQIVDFNGNRSGQTDVVVYDPRLLAPLMFSQDTGAFPVDTCLLSIEVKSTLDATELRKSIDGARSLRLLRFAPQPKPVRDPRSASISVETHPLPIPSLLFAFTSDLTQDSELDRYLRLDGNGRSDPAIQMICVLGKGLWRFEGSGRWACIEPTKEYDEVIGFLGVLVNTLADVSQSRGFPKIGNYLFANVPVKYPDIHTKNASPGH